MGLGFKDFGSETLTSSDVDGYLMRQTMMVFADTAARDTALSAVLAEGMFCFTTAGDNTWYYDGSAWVAFMSTWANLASPVWTNVTVGNATQTVEYRYTGSEMRVRGVFVLGSTSAIGTGPQLTIPESKTSRSTGGGSLGSAYMVDTSATNKPYAGLSVVSQSDTQIAFVGSDDNAVTATTPFTWATGDTLRFDIHIAL